MCVALGLQVEENACVNHSAEYIITAERTHGSERQRSTPFREARIGRQSFSFLMSPHSHSSSRRAGQVPPPPA
jgi:SET domain-containing protein